MKLNVRFALLISALLAALIGSILLLNAAHETQTKRSVNTLLREQGRQLDQLMVMTEYPLHQFARDYSLWDDMVTFVGKPSAEWARVNIDASVDNFHLDGAWVFDKEGYEIYRCTRPPLATDAKLPIAPTELMAALHESRFAHFFARSGGELLEFEAAPIQSSADTLRISTPTGWFVAARRWDDQTLQSLAEVIRAQIALESANTPELRATRPGAVEFGRALPGLDGKPIARLRLHFEPEELVNLSAYGRQILAILVFQGMLTLAVAIVGLHYWVVRPFKQISQSLATHDPKPVELLSRSGTELGHIARLVSDHFDAVSALQRSKESLDRALEERVRLGRDLHDSVIQSIYAAGMGLEATRGSLRSDPGAAEKRIEEIRATLNETIRQVRGYIVRLEQEDLEERPFRESVSEIVKQLSNGRSIKLTCEIDNEVAEALPFDLKTHALEAIRDTLRDAIHDRGATQCTVALRPTDGAPTLAITDNGGKPPAARQVAEGLRPGRAVVNSRPGENRTIIQYSLS